MRRRDVLGLLSGAAVAWPLESHSQQDKLRHVGVLLGLSTGPDDPGADEILRPFKETMREAGWIEGNNMQLDVRFGGGNLAKINAASDDLVALRPELIYATGLPPVQALRQRTRAETQ
jgi:putative ABC transport system substrate-binding protein